jgi:alpha-amylase
MYFIFAVHNHQPVGNFDHVLENAYTLAYEPFIRILSEHPKLKFSFHTSGYLLDWLLKERPDYIELIKSMVMRGQVEIMGGGYYEPILAVIPREDRLGQIRLMSERIEELFGVRPRGLWLAERVWDPTIPKTLNEAGIEYVVVDDYHFIKSGLKGEDLFGYYITEDLGYPVKVFPGSERLRYLVPFKPVEQFVEFMRISKGMSGEEAATVYADDGEKFGIWPSTNKLVYKEGWLKRFIEKVEDNLGWIQPVTFSEYMENEGPLGRVYLPTTSYMEMGEWALPAEASFEYTTLRDKLASSEDGVRVKRFLQGGMWRNFFSKYTEANWMHKRMLGVSHAFKEAKGLDEEKEKKARRHLYMAQCNDAYWHGVFGGLYLPHLRTSVYENIIKAEAVVDGENVKPAVIKRDFDADTFDEILLSSKDLNVFVSPERGGTIVELDLRPAGVNFTNTLSRRFEGYHMKLKTYAAVHSAAAKSIHERVVAKEEGLERLLIFDTVERASLRDHFLKGDESLESFISSNYREQGDFYNGPYTPEVKNNGLSLTRRGTVGSSGIVVKKEIELSGNDAISIAYKVEAAGGTPPEGKLAVEFNLCLPGCNGPACSYEVSGRPPRRPTKVEEMGLGSTGEVSGVERVAVVDRYSGINVNFDFKKPVNFWRFPLETVSLSESGFERNYQGSCLVFLVPLVFDSKGVVEFYFDLRVESCRAE